MNPHIPYTLPRTLLLFAALAMLLTTACSRTKRYQPEQIADIPTHQLTRTDWDTSARLMVYHQPGLPVVYDFVRYFESQPPHIQNQAGNEVFRTNLIEGYAQLNPLTEADRAELNEAALSPEKRLRVRQMVELGQTLARTMHQAGYQIVSPETYMNRKVRSQVDRVLMVNDFMLRSAHIKKGGQLNDALVSVSVFESDRPDSARYFEAWGRAEDRLPFEEAARDLLNMDAFRAALVVKR